ncbi:MAG: Alcohol dehydrogenase zinc-binding domain protein, partial [Sphingobacterium sp.]|nr:Alcohol dehydrogenase zinc-binding domain protein [Sphingobacterium sp.]
FGDPSVFKESEVPRPEIIPGHVLIEVKATSVNPVDCRIRSGQAPGMAPALPAILHGDVAGIVVEVGQGVTSFNVGDEVYGLAGGTKGTMGGALADYILADADFLALKPRSLSMAESAALPLVSLAVWQALIDRGNIQNGQKVLIHAAAGGVGHIAIQIAKWAGAEVYTTATTAEKLSLGIELGAIAAIDFEKETVRDYVAKYTGQKGFDLVFDTVGGHNLEKSFEAVKSLGQVLSIATRGTHDLSLMNFKGLTLHVIYTMYPLVSGLGRIHYGEIMEKITQIVDKGQLRPILDPRVFTFNEVGAAHRHLESGNAFGKVVLVNKS